MIVDVHQNKAKSPSIGSRIRRGTVAFLGAAAVTLGAFDAGIAPTTGAGAQAQIPALPNISRVSGSSDFPGAIGMLPGGAFMAPAGCAPHIVVNVPGGGNTTSNLPETLPIGPYVAQIGKTLREKHPGQVIDRYVSYNSIPGFAQPYEQIRDGGYAITRNLIAREAAACPNATFSVVGYSMGADIAARIINDIAHDRGPIAANRLDSAVMISNPNRSARADVEQVGGAPRTDGAFGELEGGYGALGNRVLEVCRQGDAVCDTPYSAAPLTAAFARTAILTGFMPLAQVVATVVQLSPLDKAAFYSGLLQFVMGWDIHAKYDPVNAIGIGIGYVESHLGMAKEA